MIQEMGFILVPGIISTLIYRFLKKDKIKIYSYIEYYAIFTFFIYFVSSSFMYFRGLTDYSIALIDWKEQIKYGVVCIICAVVMPYIGFYCRNRLISLKAFVEKRILKPKEGNLTDEK